MALLYVAVGLGLVALALPTTAQIPLSVRYRRLSDPHRPAAGRVIHWFPVHLVLPLLPRRSIDSLRMLLLHADMSEKWSVSNMVTVKLLFAISFGLLMLLYWHKSGHLLFLLAIPVQAVAGWSLPDYCLKRRITARLQAINRELPHVLTGLAICLQTGSSVRSALLELATMHQSGALGRELQRMAAHLRSGAAPLEAVTAMTDRCGAPELHPALGRILNQAERGGHAAGSVAAEEAGKAWRRLKHRAETLAHTASFKLFLPQLLLAFPALLLILLSPVFLRLVDLARSFR